MLHGEWDAEQWAQIEPEKLTAFRMGQHMDIVSDVLSEREVAFVRFLAA